jgi:hypothetical protein
MNTDVTNKLQFSEKGIDEKNCPSCGAVIKKIAAICPQCGVPVKKSGGVIAAFWLNIFFGIMGLVGGGCAYNASRLSDALSGESTADVAFVGTFLFWTAVVAIVGGSKIKNSKPIGWKLSAVAAGGCVFAALIGSSMQPLIWASAYGFSAFLGRKELTT